MNKSRTIGTCSTAGGTRRGSLIVVHADLLQPGGEKDIVKWSSTFNDTVQFHGMSEGCRPFNLEE
jgi:hypothetical protein